MSASTSPTDLNFLIDLGKELPNLLRNAKNRPVIANHDIGKRVKDIVTSVLNSIANAPKNAGLAKESIQKLVTRIEGILVEFIEYDSDNKSVYEQLVKEVCDFQCRKQVSTAPQPHIGNLVTAHADAFEDSESFDEAEFDLAFRKFSVDNQRFLCCFILFPEEAEIKKREIIHCWLGMGLTDSSVGERLLAKFVASGLIDRKISNKKLHNTYKMPRSVRSKLVDQETTATALPQMQNDGSWSVLLYNKHDSGGHVPTKRLIQRNMTMATAKFPNDNVDTEALLNVKQGTLNASRFRNMSGMDKLKVVHLGSWQQDSKKYVVVEDIEALKYVKSLSQVAFLSLEGVSGMVKLPESICELRLLKVLDLRACNNLEQLPSGIKSLKNLTHLDLSGCYLLDHVPHEITFLTNLQVLKGFIVTTEQYPVKPLKKERRKGKGIGATSSSSCPFPKLSMLDKLSKLTIMTRRMNFPTAEDFHTLCELEQLSCLRITWAGSSTAQVVENKNDDLGSFPPALRKLELQAAPEHTTSRLLHLISDGTKNCSLEKLYIRGGELRDLDCFFPQPMAVRLRYLPELQIHWDDFKKLFPNLSRLDVLGCPNLISFPCDDNGVWELVY